MKRIGWVIAAMALAISVAAPGATRIENPKMQGVFVSFGLGPSRSTLTSDYWRRELDTESGVTSKLRAGFAFEPYLLFGIEGSVGSFSSDDMCWRYVATAFTLTYYPHDNLFVKAGPMFGQVDHRWGRDGDWMVTVVTYGWGAHAAIGGDIRLSKRYSLLPVIQYEFFDFDPGSFRQLAFLLEFGVFF